MGMFFYKKVVDEFYISLKVIKEKEQKKLLFEKNKQILNQQKIEIIQLKEIATLKYNHSSAQTAEIHPLLRASRVHSTLQPQQLFRSLVRPVGNFFEKIQSWRAIPSFYCRWFAMKWTPDMILF